MSAHLRPFSLKQKEQAKGRHSVASKDYTHLHGQVTAAIRKDKEHYMQQQCEKLKKQTEMGNIKGLFQMVKRLGRNQNFSILETNVEKF